MARGCLLSVHGADCSGKSTFVKELLAAFQPCVVFKYPNRNRPLGSKIDLLLRGKLTVCKQVEIKWFADDRAQDQQMITNLLEKGINVICDRYIHCSMAYNSLHSPLTLKQILSYDANNRMPDLCILMDADYSSQRADFGSEKYDHSGKDRDSLLLAYIESFVFTKTPFMFYAEGIPEIKKAIRKIQSRTIEL